MTLEDYSQQVTRLGREFAENGLTAMDDLANLDQSFLHEVAAFRTELLSESDRKRYAGLLASGLFKSLEEDKRLGLIVFGAEIDAESSRFELERQCDVYRDDQLLFARQPELFRDVLDGGHEDLIPLDCLTPLADYAAFKTRSGYAKLSHLLSPQIVSWAKQQYPKAKLFIRVDPHRFYEQKPRMMLSEMTIRPADPGWFSRLSLRPGMKDGAQYDLDPGELPQDQMQYWEYHILEIRRLEFVARRKPAYLSMMFEELPECDNNRQLVEARCVHLDNEDRAGRPLERVTMKHLDLAINVYSGEDKMRRWRSRLFEGQATDATFRTHVLRIEDVPLDSAFAFCRMFFQSETLLNELVAGLAIPASSTGLA